MIPRTHEHSVVKYVVDMITNIRSNLNFKNPHRISFHILNNLKFALVLRMDLKFNKKLKSHITLPIPSGDQRFLHYSSPTG